MQYAKAKGQLQGLKKRPTMSMQKHIDQFEKLREVGDINAPAGLSLIPLEKTGRGINISAHKHSNQ